MIAWSPVDPDLPLSDLWGEHCLAYSADGRGLMLSVRLPPARAPQPPGDAMVAQQVSITSHASYGWPRRRTTLLPGYLPVQAACIARGLVPHRIVFVPEPKWPPVGQPTVATPRGTMSLSELIRHGPPASVRLQGALATADAVKTTYGRMLADIAYRIENSALFDPSVPTTRSFDNALAVWDGLNLASSSEDDVALRANTLKLAFDTARSHAETVGLGHLPATARADARRASSAARLAVGTKTDGERVAAQEQVIRILRSLSLHYLPDPDQVTLQITAGGT